MFFKKREQKPAEHKEILENVRLNTAPRYEVARVLTDDEEKHLSFSSNKRDCDRELYSM